MCAQPHSRNLVKGGGADERLYAPSLTEAVTRVAERGGLVPDAAWAEVARHDDEQVLADC